MMMRCLKCFLMGGFLLIAQSAHADTVLYCAEDVSTGLSNSSGSWKTTDFKLERFSVKVIGDFSQIIKDDNIYDCRPAFSASFEPHRLTCFHTASFSDSGNIVEYGGLPKVFHFNAKTQRFVDVSVSTYGFTEDGTQDNSDTDSMSGGKCENF